MPIIMHRSVAAVQGIQQSNLEAKDELLEEDLPSPLNAVEFDNSRSNKANFSELTVVTESPPDLSTRPSPKSSFQNDDTIMEAVEEQPISSISGDLCLDQSIVLIGSPLIGCGFSHVLSIYPSQIAYKSPGYHLRMLPFKLFLVFSNLHDVSW